jgi:hypothetical protein
MPEYVFVPSPYDVNVSATDVIDLGEKEKSLTFSVKYGIDETKSATVEATVGVDLSLVSAYNSANSKSLTPFPEAHVSFPNSTVRIATGSLEGSVDFSLIDLDKLPNGEYLLPVTVKSVNASNGFPLHPIKKTVYYTISNKSASLMAQWEFDDAGNFAKATLGDDLELVGSGFYSVSGPAGGKGVHVPKGSYFKAAHNIDAPSGVTEYTILMDIQYPAKGVYYTLYQTDLSNTSDGDLFIRPGDGSIGVGALGNTATPVPPDNLPSYTLPPGEWHRIVISVKLGAFYKIYVDGELHLHKDDLTDNGRYTLDPKGVIFFGDNDGEDADMDVAEVRIWDGALGATRIQALGAAGVK